MEPSGQDLIFEKKIFIQVGGKNFKTTNTLLRKYPDTLLGSLRIESRYYNAEENCYCFDRNPELFNTILDFYRNDSVHLPKHICGYLWKAELKFWNIPLKFVSECCYPIISTYDSEMAMTKDLKETIGDSNENIGSSRLESSSQIRKVKNTIWMFLNEPKSSTAAKVFSVCYLFLVLISSLIPCLESMREIRTEHMNETTFRWLVATNRIIISDNMVDNPKLMMWATTKEPDFLLKLGICLDIFFSLETLLRFICSPRKIVFLKSFLNILDMFLFTNVWVRNILKELYKSKLLSNRQLAYFFGFCEVLSVFRLLRFFRIAKQFSNLQILLISFKQSGKEFLLLMLTFFIFAWLFANLIFFSEVFQPDTFPNIPSGLWWSIITMTTVGYGDSYPTGSIGKVVGVTCALSGLLVLAMPIAVIAGTFDRLKKRKDDQEAYLIAQKEDHVSLVSESKDLSNTCIETIQQKS